MAGLYNNGLPQLNSISGAELLNLDTQAANGVSPQSAATTTFQGTLYNAFLGNQLDKTMVAGSRYYISYIIGSPQTFTGIAAAVGTTGGTDTWLAELHGPTGLLLATSATAGITAGTASTWMQLPFTATYTVTVPGTYYLAVQSSGTTAKLSTVNVVAVTGVVTGSATGVFGTGASITVPTTYTANLGPRAILY